MMFLVISLLFILTLLVGCNKKEGLSNPVFNWEGANGEGFALPIGTELYKIKDIEITHSFDGMMAVKVDKKFKVARRLNEP